MYATDAEKADAAGLGYRVDPAERDLEAPPEDAAEQATPADPADVPLAEQMEVHRGLEVDEADAIEQSQVVNLEDEG